MEAEQTTMKMEVCPNHPSHSRKNTTRLTPALVFGLAAIGLVEVALAEAWVFQPAVTLGQRYDDNLQLTTDPHDSTWGTELTGSVEVSRLTDITQIRGLVRADYIDYRGNDDIDDDDRLFLNLVSAHQAERSTWNFDASYRRDSTSRTEVFVGFQPDDVPVGFETDVDAGLIQTRVERNRLFLNPYWTYDLSERTQVSLAYQLTDVTYETNPFGLSDFDRNEVSAGLLYGLNETDRVGAVVDVGRYTSDADDREFDSYALSGTFDRNVTETTTAGFRAGVYKATFEPAVGDDEETGFTVGFNASTRTELLRLTGSLERRLAPSGSGELVQSDILTLRMTRELSPTTTFLLFGRYFENQSLADVFGVEDREYLSVEPRLRWNLTEHWLLDASYHYRRSERAASPSADSNAVLFQIGYTWPTGTPTGK